MTCIAICRALCTQLLLNSLPARQQRNQLQCVVLTLLTPARMLYINPVDLFHDTRHVTVPRDLTFSCNKRFERLQNF